MRRHGSPVYKVNWSALHKQMEAYRRDLVGANSPLLAHPTPDEEPQQASITGLLEVLHSDNPDNSASEGVCRQIERRRASKQGLSPLEFQRDEKLRRIWRDSECAVHD